MKQLIFFLMFSPLFASYQNAASNDLTKKTEITDREGKTRARVSDSTKLIKIYFMDLKKLRAKTNNQKHLTI